MKCLDRRFRFIIIAIGITVCRGDDYKISLEDDSGRKTRNEFGNAYSTTEECSRTCKVGEPRKTCYYKFTVEYYSTLGRACDTCRQNSSLVNDCACITGDGYEKSGLMVVDRMYPGPAIITCLNDYIVVDVTNHVPGNAITIHWHGLFQKDYQYYDGVPHVTQCPIGEGETFRYQFTAQNAGTHFWHAHSGLHKASGLTGPLIVREPKSKEPNGRLWDYDKTEHTIFITDWLHDDVTEHYPGNYVRRTGQYPDNFLINGKGQWTDPISGNTTTTPLAVYTVKPGHRYRFRMINACSFGCPVTMTIEGHDLKVLASDGEPLKPLTVASITSFSAERYDFVLDTHHHRSGTYWIQLVAGGRCARNRMQQMAILRYEVGSTAVVADDRKAPEYGTILRNGLELNPLNIRCNEESSASKYVCISQLRGFKKAPKEILKQKPDVKLYLPFGFHDYKPEEIYKPGTFRKFIVAGGGPTTGLLGNISNNFPPVPMISQRKDIPDDKICNSRNKNEKCTSTPCECIHIEDIPLDSVVEIVLVDEAQIPGMSHPYHLHGHSFFVLGEGCAEEYNISNIDVDTAMDLDKQGIIKRNWENPPAKDTFAVPNNGFMVIRFLANNPGYWLFHCHFLIHLSVGMTAVFHTGNDSDLPPIPEGFPRCGNFLPPIDNY